MDIILNKKTLFIFFITYLLILITAYSARGEIGEDSSLFNINSEKLMVNIQIKNTIFSNASRINANLTVFPKNYSNQATIINPFPKDSVVNFDDNQILFEFDKKGRINFGVDSEVNTTLFIVQIFSDPSLRNLELPEEIEEYIKNTTNIFYDSSIKNKAQQLAKEGILETAYSLAEYVRKTMTYDLVFSEVKNSSWVMKNKRGVCTHYSILFIALARSLKIPSRLVSGVAYSNQEKKFIEHSWAEIWIPNTGWVPFDITFYQYGWIDASHIVFQKSEDVSSAISYSYIGNLTFGNLSISTSIVNQEGVKNIPLKIGLRPYINESDFDSYIPLEVIVENTNDYYLILPIKLSVSPGYFGETEKIVFLEPHKIKKVYFLIYVPKIKECYQGCISEIKVEDVFSNSKTTEIIINKNFPKIDLREAEQIIKIYSQERNEEIDFSCNPQKEFFYNYENISIICNVKTLKESLKEIKVCERNNCRIIAASNKEQEIEFKIEHLSKNESHSMNCFFICLTAFEEDELLTTSCVNVKTINAPKIKISAFQNVEADFGSTGNFQLVVESDTAITTNLSIDAKNVAIKKEIFLEKGTNLLNIEIPTWKMNIGKNTLTIKIEYEDNNKREYQIVKELDYIVKDVGFFKKILIRLTKILGKT